MTAQEYRNLMGSTGGVLRDSLRPAMKTPSVPKTVPPVIEKVSAAPIVKPKRTPPIVAEPVPAKTPKASPQPEPAAKPVSKPEAKPESPKVEPPVVEPTPTPEPEEQPWRLVGEAFQTYVMVEQGDKLLLIDKHAAHERMNFDRLKAQGYTPMVQELLTPVVFEPPVEEGALLLEHLADLEHFGFRLEDFGGGALLIRACPDYLDSGDISPTLSELAEQLRTAGRTNPDSARDALMHTMACKAAIKGGQKNSPAELLRVAQAVMSGQVRYCPHGRPVAIELEKRQLEHQFKRC